MRRRAIAVVAWGTCAVSMSATLAPFVYRTVIGPAPGFEDQPGSLVPTVAVLLFIVSFASVGALIAWKRPENPIGWLLSVAGLCYALGAFAILLGIWSPRWSDWMNNWVWGLGIGIAGTFVLLLFPTGALPSRRWRWAAWLSAIALILSTLGNALAPGVIEGQDYHSVNPLGVEGALGPVFRALQASFPLVLVAFVAAVVSVVVRFRRSRSPEREQLEWLVYAAGLVGVGIIASILVTKAVADQALATNLQNGIISASFVFVPVAIGIAILKYRLYEIDVVVNRTLVYGSLAAFITAVYVAIVVGIGSLVGGGSDPNIGLSIAATAVVAVAFQPMRTRVQHLANRMVYGRRATPYEVLTAFSQRMADAPATDEALPRIARALAEGTGAARATVWLRVGDVLRPAGTWPQDDQAAPDPVRVSGDDLPDMGDASLVLPVRHRTELLGALAVSKQPGDRLTPAEERLAGTVASQSGLVLRNVRLHEELADRLWELQASRARIVAAQDRERRRLERNVHDGAQQQLVALSVKLGLARTVAERDPAAADAILAQVEADSSNALDDILDLARGVYPPLLAEAGLAEALRSQAQRSPVPVEVQLDGVGRYGREIEAAVYFATLEALQNVTKYAGASRAVVRMDQTNGTLTFAVQDDGAGFDPAATGYGTGLQGMADRLEAIGGSLRVTSAPGEGTTVLGRVPTVADRP